MMIPKHKSGLLAFLLICSLLLPILPQTAAALAQITFTMDGVQVQTDVAPQLIAGRVLLPLRIIFEALGATVAWDPSEQLISAKRGETTVQLWIGRQQALVNGRTTSIDVPPRLIEQRTFVPVRFVSECLGAGVNWDPAKRLVSVVNPVQAPELFVENGLSFCAKVEGREFLLYENGVWQQRFLRGVNIGAGKPGYFPGELAVTKEEYLRWFGYISAMNADVIRVYTTMRPEFYDALLQFNRQAAKPLYLIQGVWINENSIAQLYDAYADQERILRALVDDSKELVDIFHGQADLPERPGVASGHYRSDISPYVIGWILGIEWDPYFVEKTNAEHPERTDYQGRYLYTAGASPFEAFLCKAGDQVLSYEADKYQMLRPLSYSNWPTTDMLSHPNEPFALTEDAETVNVEHIRWRDILTTGCFASYHIYPYYPDFLNYQPEYLEFRDEDGKSNPYRAYLRSLFSQHTMPVMVAEVGVPASRGKGHDSPALGYSQGQHDEAEQGRILAELLGDIRAEGYAGGLVFAWQDEWFKRTWNTALLDLPDDRPFWSNPQTNEQEFGLLAFDPGDPRSICYVDGQVDDWASDVPLASNQELTLFAKADEKYLYLLVQAPKFDPTTDTLYIPLDTLPGQGNSQAKDQGLQFSQPAEFLLQIGGAQPSRVLVDAHYDVYQYLYAEKERIIAKTPAYRVSNSGCFNPINLLMSRALHLPQEDRDIPIQSYETGLLRQGNANPDSPDYNSLTDFAIQGKDIEIRLPWQLISVMNPSKRMVMSDFYAENAIKGQQVAAIALGAAIRHSGGQTLASIDLQPFSWPTWVLPTYHERLKPSYYILQQAFAKMK